MLNKIKLRIKKTLIGVSINLRDRLDEEQRETFFIDVLDPVFFDDKVFDVNKASVMKIITFFPTIEDYNNKLTLVNSYIQSNEKLMLSWFKDNIGETTVYQFMKGKKNRSLQKTEQIIKFKKNSILLFENLQRMKKSQEDIDKETFKTVQILFNEVKALSEKLTRYSI